MVRQVAESSKIADKDDISVHHLEPRNERWRRPPTRMIGGYARRRCHHENRRQRKAGFSRVHRGVVSGDHPCFLELLDPLMGPGRGETDRVPQLLIRRASVVSQQIQNPSINCIHIEY